MKTVCEENQCCGCMGCISVCSKSAIQIQDNLKAYNAVIDLEKCIDCGACTRVCIQQNTILALEPLRWYQGWCEDEKIRVNGSSGGVASAISRSFLEAGGVVCSCLFLDGEFKFSFAEKENDLKLFVGSKYVKSNPTDIYQKIRLRLINNQKVLFIGLPCQVAALKRVISEKLQENLYLIDLICHGTPSPQLLEIFVKQYGYSLKRMTNICFRVKGKCQVLDGYQGMVTNGVTDKYMISFLKSLSYTDNCYSCQFATTKRVSDITIGDSWGSSVSMEQQKKGVSLMLVQTQKGLSVLNKAAIHLESVDIENAILHNHQLYEPSEKPQNRNKFFEKLEQGHTFNSLVYKCFPKECLKQDFKRVLIKMGIRKTGILNYGVMIKGGE